MTEPSAAIAVSPLVTYLAPIISTLALALVGVAVRAAVAELRKLTGIQFKQAAIDDITARSEAGVGAAIAAAADNLATAKITVGNPIVSSIVRDVINDAPVVLDHAGFDSSNVTQIVLGAFGRMQASMTSVPVPTSDTLAK